MTLVILDVGHGNSALLTEAAATTVLDVAPGPVVTEALKQAGIMVVDQVIISHADADHCGGLIGLLLSSEISVRSVWINTDLAKKTRTWQALLRALAVARQRAAVRVLPGLTSDHDVNGSHLDFKFEILAPNPMLVLKGGPGQIDEHGQQITSNTLSAVVRVWYREAPLVLFAGDIDSVGLNYLLAEIPKPRAKVLVFPHHGGLPGGVDAAEFARLLCRAVEPEVVVFSLARNRFGNPKPEIVSAVREAAPAAHIICTQLSEHCAKRLPTEPPEHLSGRVAQGAWRNACCGGSLQLQLDGMEALAAPTRDNHGRFVQLNAETALCRR